MKKTDVYKEMRKLINIIANDKEMVQTMETKNKVSASIDFERGAKDNPEKVTLTVSVSIDIDDGDSIMVSNR